ncbi:hypothetical protein JCM24511_04534 [Saitozyma sp. JCM 24511]|nr:hypothetical protein JCM24511_04534 [Saitozyma sp. JCM 24511]
MDFASRSSRRPATLDKVDWSLPIDAEGGVQVESLHTSSDLSVRSRINPSVKPSHTPVKYGPADAAVKTAYYMMNDAISREVADHGGFSALSKDDEGEIFKMLLQLGLDVEEASFRAMYGVDPGVNESAFAIGDPEEVAAADEDLNADAMEVAAVLKEEDALARRWRGHGARRKKRVTASDEEGWTSSEQELEADNPLENLAGEKRTRDATSFSSRPIQKTRRRRNVVHEGGESCHKCHVLSLMVPDEDEMMDVPETTEAGPSNAA